MKALSIHDMERMSPSRETSLVLSSDCAISRKWRKAARSALVLPRSPSVKVCVVMPSSGSHTLNTPVVMPGVVGPVSVRLREAGLIFCGFSLQTNVANDNVHRARSRNNDVVAPTSVSGWRTSTAYVIVFRMRTVRPPA